MTAEEVMALFEKHDEEFLKFDRVRNPRSNRPDLNAFLLLDQLVSVARHQDIVSGAEHDQISLSIKLDELARVATEEDIVTLLRCGVLLNDSNEWLSMLV